MPLTADELVAWITRNGLHAHLHAGRQRGTGWRIVTSTTDLCVTDKCLKTKGTRQLPLEG